MAAYTNQLLSSRAERFIVLRREIDGMFLAPDAVFTSVVDEAKVYDTTREAIADAHRQRLQGVNLVEIVCVPGKETVVVD